MPKVSIKFVNRMLIYYEFKSKGHRGIEMGREKETGLLLIPLGL